LSGNFSNEITLCASEKLTDKPDKPHVVKNCNSNFYSALRKLPSLETMMAESRKYGGCVMAGVQSFPQLTNTYGHNQAQTILDLFNTKIFFRNTDPNTTQWISKVLGEAETTEHIENLSYGANTIRDGVSLSQNTQTKPLILPTEIANLKDLEAFIKLPGTFPVGRVEAQYKC